MNFLRRNLEIKPIFIAEVGQNHQGDINLAKKYINIFSKAGADIIKFQSRDNKNLFDKDFNRAAYNAEQLLESIDVCDTAREVIVEMVFQLGIGGVSKFKKMFEALRKKDYNEAANQMLDSQWRVQTPKRCQELSDLMRTCA